MPPQPPSGYQVIMWVLDGYTSNQDLFFQRMHDLDVTAVQVSRGDLPDAPLQHGFDYYVENIHRIGFLHEAHKVYEDDWNGYAKTRDKRYLIRKPSLQDPDYLGEAKGILQGAARQYVGLNPLLYDIGDECSITSFASPMDYDFSGYALAAFRDWLKQQYGTLDKLNAEWETEFATWDDVQPMTTYEIKEREKKGSENYSPWADHRTFMDVTYAETVDQFRRWLHEIDPKTPAGLEGAQMPAAFGGYDLWRLSHAVDWVEPYDIGGSHAIFRSFLPAGAPMYATIFEHDAKPASRRLWHLLLNGDRGSIIWCSSDWFDYSSPQLTPKPWVAGMADLFAELRGPAAQAIMNATRDRAQIAIHYSHPSIQAAWMIDSRPDGDTWIRRFSSYEGVHSGIARVRNGWMKLVEDLGLQYDFVSAEQIEAGKLGELGYKVLVLPESLAIGEEEAAQIEAFVRNGGTVIADFLPGVFDEHAKRRKTGVLDGLFGVSRPSEYMVEQPEKSEGIGFVRDRRQVTIGPAELTLGLIMGKPTAMVNTPVKMNPMVNNVPVIVERSIEKGRTVYLNISPIDYPKDRLVGKGGDLRGIVSDILRKSGVTPAVKVTGEPGAPVGCEVITYAGEGCRYVAIMRNPEYAVSELGELGFTDNSRFEKPEQLTVDFGQSVEVKELLSGREFGKTDRVEVALDPWKPVVLEVRK
ncbi:MAG: beta-galactosidase trimerization domain-containing protein [Armatimonadota bacterium]|jgi:hypothetical protein